MKRTPVESVPSNSNVAVALDVVPPSATDVFRHMTAGRCRGMGGQAARSQQVSAGA